MKKNVDISVIIVTHNRDKLLISAIDSVLNQKFSNFELIIIDDASTDNTENFVKKYLADNRVRYIKISKANSISQVRNYAWSYVNGEYVAVLDSDDVWCDDLKLKKQFDFLDNNHDFVIVGSGAVLIDGQNKDLDVVYKPGLDEDIRRDFFEKNPFFHSSVMFKMDVIKKIGGYDEKIKFGEDFDLWLRMGSEGKLFNFHEPMIKYRVHNDNEAKKHSYNAIVDVLRIIRKNRKKYNISRFIFFKKIFRKFSEYFKPKD